MDLERLYRDESGRILATLIRLLGDFDVAEEAMQEAFAVAVEQWPAAGMPDNPRTWLVGTARHKAVDRLRRRRRFETKGEELAHLIALEAAPDAPEEADDAMADDPLRLIFTCCHPALAVEAQVALTLRTLGGLTTEEVARAFLVPVPTMAQRLVRAKQKIRTAGIPYRVPPDGELAERLEAVMLVLYLVFNEGYAATSGDAVIRRELSAEAIRLGRLLVELMPGPTEPRALLALMLLQDSRRSARVSSEGDLVLLEDQDRRRWDQAEIREGLALAETALRDGGPRVYALQAAIAARHARAARAEETDWRQIARLYDELGRLNPSPVIELNRAAAVAMAEGPEVGLRLLGALEAEGRLRDYALLPSARADLLRRLGRWTEAAAAYRQALDLTENDPQRRFLARRLAEVEARAAGR
jgi:RNA polymerase sigma-70 factor (ECF subfamily)